MGLLGSLFGKKEPEAVDRCMECGMTGGRHTEWCPAVPAASETPDRAGTDSADTESRAESR